MLARPVGAIIFTVADFHPVIIATVVGDDGGVEASMLACIPKVHVHDRNCGPWPWSAGEGKQMKK